MTSTNNPNALEQKIFAEADIRTQRIIIAETGRLCGPAPALLWITGMIVVELSFLVVGRISIRPFARGRIEIRPTWSSITF